MFEQDVVKGEYILGYILALLGLSWSLVALVASGLLSFFWLTLLPFIPGLAAFLFLSLEGHPVEVHARPLLARVTVPSVLVAVAYPLLLVGLAALVALGTGLGYLKPGETGTGFAAMLAIGGVAFLSAIPASLGQEYGYRGYLFPALVYWQGRTMATLSVGVVWGLATAPVSYLVLSVTGSDDPLALALLGFLLVVAVSFAFSFCASLSASILPVTLMNVLLLTVVPAVFPASWDPRMPAAGGLIGVTWPSPLPLLLFVALAFVPVFLWLFGEMDGEVVGDGL
jgi:membrane protease YdiL (CAAX protease family)